MVYTNPDDMSKLELLTSETPDYRQQLQNVDVVLMNGGLFVKFDEEQRGITPGQFIAFYIDDELVASGVIN